MLLPFFLPVFLTCPIVSTQSVDYNLKSVHVVFRHGDSVLVTPDLYPHDPKAPHDFDPRAQADLTNAGRMRSYKLGQYLRSRYSDFLGEEYRREDVYARSTYPERARASLLLALAGLYPPEAKQRWHPTLDWQPISIEVPMDSGDDTLMWSIDCPAYLEEREHTENTPEFAASMASFVDFFVQLSNVTSQLGHETTEAGLTELPDVTSLRDEITEAELTELYHKLRIGIDADDSVPDWSDVLISAKITRNAAILRYHTQNNNDRLRRLNGGMLLKKILDDMAATIDGAEMAKINLYSGQEFNVVALLWALDAWKPIVPYYSTAVIVELWEKDAAYYVKVLYHDGLTGETEARTIEGCAKMCPLLELTTLRQNVLPLDSNECYTDNDARKQCFKKQHETIRESRD